jgi:hypothetical protein
MPETKTPSVETASALEPLLDVLPIARVANDAALIKLAAACARNGVDTPVDLARVLAAAGGVLMFAAGNELFVNPANFAFAVHAAKRAGAL